MEHLNRHILTHTGERPFKCEVEGCGRCFSRQDTLLRHLKVHNKSRDKKKKQKQTKKTQKKKTKNSVKRKSVQEDNLEESNKKQKFDSITISSSSKESNLNISTESLLKNSNINSKIDDNEKDYSTSTIGNNIEIFSEPKDILNTEGNNSNSINSNYNSNYNTLNTDSNSSYIKNKPIPVSNIDEAMKLFNLSSSSPSQSSNSVFNTYEEQSMVSNRYKNDKFDYETTSNIDITINTSNQSRRDFSYDTSNRNSLISTENHPIFERYQDSNNYTQRLEGLDEFNLEDFNLQPSNKLSTSSANNLNNYTMFNDSLIMDMDIQRPSSSNNSISINSSSNDYNKSFTSATNSLLLSSSLNPSSYSLLVDSSISKQYNSNSNSNIDTSIDTNIDTNINTNINTNSNSNSNLNSSLSLTIPLEVNPRERNTNSFYSSMTMPHDDSKGIIHEKKSYTKKSSITIPSNFKTDGNNMSNSMNLPLGNFGTNYSSILSVQRVGIEEKGKLNNIYSKEEKRKSNNVYHGTSLSLELPSSSSSNYHSYVATEIETESKIKAMENATNSIIQQQQQQKQPSNENGNSNIINSTNTETSSNISLKTLTTSTKNEEIIDLQSSISSNYLTPPLSPSLPTSTFVECQEKTYQPTKIYPCGLDTPCIDNCNCNECIATMTLPSLINSYTDTIKEEDRNNFASTSMASPSVSLMDTSFNTMNIDTNSANESKVDPDAMTSSSSPLNEDTCHCEHCQNSNDYSHSQNIEQDNLDCINNHNHDYNNNSDHDHDIHCHCHQEDSQEPVEGVSRSLANEEEEIQVNNNIDEQVNYGEGDVIIEVGCSNVNCPNMNCPKKFFRPIASVSDGKICSTSEAMNMLNEAPCSNYNPLYHLIAAAELATNKINKKGTNCKGNHGEDENNEYSHSPSCQCTHDGNEVEKEENAQSHSTNSCKCYSTDIENCHLALSTTSPTEIEASDASNHHSNFKNYRSIKAKVGSHHHTKSPHNSNEDNVSITETNQHYNNNNNNTMTTAVTGSFNSTSIKPQDINITKDSAVLTTATSTTSVLSKPKNSDENHLFGGIYIRQDYNDSPPVTSTASYAGINYTELLANQMKLKAESNKRNIQNFEILKNELVSTTPSILSTSSAALNPVANNIQRGTSTTSSSFSSTLNASTNIFKNNKLSWMPAPIHSQLEPNINPFVLKSNLYSNVNLSSISNDKNLTGKLMENSDRAVDSCQVNILDKEEAIKQAIRCSQCPHSSRCYKRIRIEQLLN